MDTRHNILLFGPSDWWTMNPSSGTHAAEKLSRHGRVLYINPVSTDLKGTLKTSGLSTGLLRKIFRKLKSFLKAVRKVKKDLYVFSPIFIPAQGNRLVDTINNILIFIQIWAVMSALRINRRIIWLENNRAADFVRYFRSKLIVYQVSDLYIDDSFVTNRNSLIRRDSLATKKSDIIICVSKELYEWKIKSNPRTYYIPHGVDFDLFQQALASGERPAFLPETGKPVAGYYGTLTDSNDIETLQLCAEKLTDCIFVLAGTITVGDYSGLKNLPNVIFPGRIEYAEIPKLCASFDVCLLPWKMCSWIEHCNPLKLFEYMACGKPVVSVPIKEVVANYSDIISIAGNSTEFCRAISRELKHDTEKRRMKRIKIAEQNSWENHIQQILYLIDRALKEKSVRRPR